jgi:hypothetical protein
LYCSDGVSTVCLVRLFFSSKVRRQAVDEQAQVERAARLVHAVGELARDRETVLGVQLLGLGVARRRRAVEQSKCTGPCSTPLRSTSMTPRLPISPERRARKLEAVDVLGVVRVGHRQLLERLGCVARRKAKSCGTSSAWARS